MNKLILELLSELQDMLTEAGDSADVVIMDKFGHSFQIADVYVEDGQIVIEQGQAQ